MKSGFIFFKSDVECFDGTVSWSSPFHLYTSDILDAQHRPFVCVFHTNWCDCSYTADQEHGAFEPLLPVFSKLMASHL